MATLLAWLLSIGSLATTAAPGARDTAAAPACEALARAAYEQPAVSADVRAALEAHGAVVRWDPAAGPIDVWVQPRRGPTVNWDNPPAAWRDAVLDAARAWAGIVPGLELRAARDSAGAHVVVTWVDAHTLATAPARGSFASGTAGRTELSYVGGRATSAHVRLAVTTSDGVPLEAADVRAVARHELGHVLGLAHHSAAKSVMSARVQTERLHAGDQAALRLLYALPIGARCDAPRQMAAHTSPATR